MKEHAHIRTRSQRPSLPHRRSVGVGLAAGGSLGGAPGRAGAGGGAAGGRSELPRARWGRVRWATLARWSGWPSSSTWSGTLIGPAAAIGAKGGPSVGGVGGCGGDPTGVCARTQARPRRVSRCEPAAGVVLAGIGVHWAGVSSCRPAGHRARFGASSGGDREGGGDARFELSADVLAFDTTNFDTHIDTLTPGELAQRGHAKSKRKDLRVVGLGVLVSETGHVPLLYRTYSGNGSDQRCWPACLGGLAQLHEALDSGEGRQRPAQRTLVRDGGFWSPQLELDLDAAGYYSLISLPLGHKAAEEALQMAAQRGADEPAVGQAQRGPSRAYANHRWASWTVRWSWSRARSCC